MVSEMSLIYSKIIGTNNIDKTGNVRICAELMDSLALSRMHKTYIPVPS